MRFMFVLLASSALAACSGGGPTTAGGNAPPGTTGGGTAGGGVVPGSGHTFVTPTEVRTYAAIGGSHSYQYSTDDRFPAGQGQQYNQLYAGDASTARNSGITVTYNPRDAIFDVTVAAPLGNVNDERRFQDPVHRTAFGGLREPQNGVLNLTGQEIQYLEAGSGTGLVRFDPTQSTTFPIGDEGGSINVSTFFYQRPGTSTRFVTFAGFVRNAVNVVRVEPEGQPAYFRQDYRLERSAFAYGERTANSAVPTTGSGTFTGSMIATLVYNPLFDTTFDAPTYFQWLDGTATTRVNFAANTFTVDLAGTVRNPEFDVFTTRNFVLQGGATFAATGTGRVDLVNAGGFLGGINSASFTQPNGTRLGLNIAGSSVDGAFFGPAAQEVGGGFRIVGGVADERIDILGAFVGKR